MNDFGKLYYFLVLVGFIIMTACESSDSTKSEISNELKPNVEKLEVMQNQINLGLAQKSSWQKHWAVHLGGFDAADFELVMTDSIDPMEMPERNPILPGDPLFPYQLPHPEGNGTIDIYSYKVEAQESLDRPYLNPDSEVIWYRSDGMKERLLFMGPSGSFEEGIWLNSAEFLVFGFFQEEEGFRPIIWLIDLENHTFSQFKMNKVVKEYQQESYLNFKLKTVDLT
ncbi:bifunctional isocitrate dehydrogenase kinase/phosphatase [Algoriphagus sp.]|uniref:bifunctional isocitrate dehydrogenase kinase/phosphatase n=1 Tax=Algoriphagus sp. TaxID=1872435 RepID=UPI00391A266A